MSVRNTDFLDTVEYRVERTTSQLSSILPTLLKLRANKSSSEYDEIHTLLPALFQGLTLFTNSEAGSSKHGNGNSEGLLNSNPSILFSSRNLVHVAQGLNDGSPDIEFAELLMEVLSQEAATSESEFRRLGAVENIDNAIMLRSRILSLTPDGHEKMYDRLGDLGVAHLLRFQRLGELADMNKAINPFNQAVLLIPDGHADKPYLLNQLGAAYLLRSQHFFEPTDLDIAIECHSRAVLLTPVDHKRRPVRLNSLGNSFLARFQRNGESADWEKALNCLSQAMLLTNDRSERSTLFHSLAGLYQYRFVHLGDLTDVDKAAEYLSQAMLSTPEGYEAIPNQLVDFANLHESRYKRLAELADLDKAIESLSKAVFLTLEGHRNELKRLIYLASLHQRRFSRLREIVDIDKVIACQSHAVELTADSDPEKPKRLNDLGDAYQSRFEYLEEFSDVEKAIECHNQALFLCLEDHEERPSLLSSLGSAYILRFQRVGELTDINNAIELQAQAMLLTPTNHSDIPDLVSQLGIAYTLRFQRLGEIADIDNGIEHLKQAVLLTPDGAADKPVQLGNLATSFQRRFERFGDLSDIDKAIQCLNQATNLVSKGNTGELVLINNLAVAHSRRFDRLGESKDLEAAHKAFQQAAQLNKTNPRMRIACALMWAEYSLLIGVSPQQAYQRILELVPEQVGLGTTIIHRYTILMGTGNFAKQAASYAISHKDYSRALEWLEQGRSVVWNQILQLRTPFDDLSNVDPGLAKRLEKVGRALDDAGLRPAFVSEQEAHRHRQLATEWKQLLDKARQIPGFSNFLYPPKFDVLLHAAKYGPVIVINVHESRCDALIIRPQYNDVAHIPLDCFSLEKATDARARLGSLVGHQGSRAGGFSCSQSPPNHERRFKAMLSALWWEVVKPVLDFLGYTHIQPVDHLPHVTWCTTGALSFLPLHAAGCYDGLQPNAMDLVVSSYTPSLSALLASNPPSSGESSGVLAIGQECTKGFFDLPNTVNELAAIKEHAKGTRYLQLDGENATVGAVLDAMESYSWVHLACHATQSDANPSQSAFHLHDDDLVLSEIAKRSFKNKGLAFLSACQTAMGDDRLEEEAVHLAAGMLMAGYPSVIATMWAIYDEDGPEIARSVYAELLKDGKLDCTGAPRALHKAVTGLRGKVGESSFMRWMPFIHIGS